MASISEKFGNKVRKLREQEKCLSLGLPKNLGLDLTTINEVENGNRDPMLKTIWRMANALGVKISQLF